MGERLIRKFLRTPFSTTVDALGRRALVVVPVVAAELGAVELRHRRVVVDADEVGEDELADLLRERLALALALLAVALDAVPEDLVEEDAATRGS